MLSTPIFLKKKKKKKKELLIKPTDRLQLQTTMITLCPLRTVSKLLDSEGHPRPQKRQDTESLSVKYEV